MLSLDVPSGVDATTGETDDPAIEVAATMTLALPKVGLLAETAKANVGELYLADISVPPALYGRLGLEVGPIVANEEILKLR